MTDQYPSLSHQHAASALGELPPHAMPAAPDSTVPPPPANAREMWSTEEVMGLLNEERAQREQHLQELAQWQHYAQQLQADHAQLQAQYERVSQSSGASIPPGTVGDEHAQNLELQLQAAQERISHTEAELHSVRSRAEIADQQLRMLQEHVDSIPPEAPASFPPAAETFEAAGYADPSADYASPTGTGRRFSLGVLAAVAGLLIAGFAGVHFGVHTPALEAERETTRRTQELMRSETDRLRTQLDEQRAASSKQVQELTQQLREAKAAATSTPSSNQPTAAAAPARKPAAKRRAAARRRQAAKRRRSKRSKRGRRSTSHANDPIAGIGL